MNDVPALQSLIALSARTLGRTDYSEEQIEAALTGAWGVDTQLISDRTYFVVVADSQIVGCGGWSFRTTLFGGDAHTGRQTETLDPETHAARIRAFFVHPNWARQGIGRAILERCESEARAHGFHSAALIATRPGQRLYHAAGYVGEARVPYALPGGVSIDFIPMQKQL